MRGDGYRYVLGPVDAIYIYPEPDNCRFGSGKGAELLLGGVLSEHKGAKGPSKGATRK